ncbi:MAG: hypothetical protein ACYCUM_12555 [Solirubrobacteraceae bacterium]
MIATPHMLAGAAAATRVRTPAAGLAVGALTHLLLDAVPHRDYRRAALGGLVLAADLTAGTISVRLLAGRSRVTLAGAIGGLLPDLLSSAERALPLSPIRSAHSMFHTTSRTSAGVSGAVQGLVMLAAAMLLTAREDRWDRCSIVDLMPLP